MEIKCFEVLDRATLIPVICIKLATEILIEQKILRQAGFSTHPFNACILYVHLAGRRNEWDPYNWADRTNTTAHKYIKENWNTLISGDVIDVEWIKGETKTKNKSDLYLPL